MKFQMKCMRCLITEQVDLPSYWLVNGKLTRTWYCPHCYEETDGYLIKYKMEWIKNEKN